MSETSLCRPKFDNKSVLTDKLTEKWCTMTAVVHKIKLKLIIFESCFDHENDVYLHGLLASALSVILLFCRLLKLSSHTAYLIEQHRTEQHKVT